MQSCRSEPDSGASYIQLTDGDFVISFERPTPQPRFTCTVYLRLQNYILICFANLPQKRSHKHRQYMASRFFFLSVYIYATHRSCNQTLSGNHRDVAGAMSSSRVECRDYICTTRTPSSPSIKRPYSRFYLEAISGNMCIYIQGEELWESVAQHRIDTYTN